MTDTEFFSTADAAAATGADYSDLLEFAREADLPRVGTAYVWTDDDVDAYLEACDNDATDGGDVNDEDEEDEDGFDDADDEDETDDD